MCAAGSSVVAQNTGADAATHGFLDRTLDGRRYVVFVPQGDTARAGMAGHPVSAWGRRAGSDGRKQIGGRNWSGSAASGRRRFAGVVVFPQADFADGPILETWRADEPGGRLARAVLADVERQWPIDAHRRAITGWSMGGYGALSLAAADPEHWTKVLAVSGGGEPDWGPALAKLPVWLVHGTDDQIVPASESRAIVSAVPAPHNELTFTEVAGCRARRLAIGLRQRRRAELAARGGVGCASCRYDHRSETGRPLAGRECEQGCRSRPRSSFRGPSRCGWETRRWRRSRPGFRRRSMRSGLHRGVESRRR